MGLSIKRTAFFGGADATVATSANLWTAFHDVLIAAGWVVAATFSASDKVYKSTGESGTEKIWIRMAMGTTAVNVLQFGAYQYWNETETATGSGLDANVLGRWKMDEAAGTTIADDSGNGYDLTAGATFTVSETPYAVIGRARVTDGNTTTGAATRASDATIRTACEGSWTVDAWVKVTTAARQPVFSVSANANRELLSCEIDSGRLQTNWRNTANTLDVLFTGTTILRTGYWYHCAWVKDWNGSNAVVKLYINGVLDATSGNLGNTAAGGTTGQLIRINQNITGAGSNLVSATGARFDHVRFSNIARNQAAITAAFEAGNGAIGGYNNIGFGQGPGTGADAWAQYTVTFGAAGTAYDFVFLADKDNFAWTIRTNATTNQHWYGAGGRLYRAAQTKDTSMVTTATLDVGLNVTVNVSADPIAAGYAVDDIVFVIAQQATWDTYAIMTSNVIPQFQARIVDITTSSITLHKVPQKCLTGALIGDDPMPVFIHENTQSFPYASIFEHMLTWPSLGVDNIFYKGITGTTVPGDAMVLAIGKQFQMDCPYRLHAAELDPNNRTSRHVITPWLVRDRPTATPVPPVTPSFDSIRGTVGKFHYNMAQSALGTIGRDPKAPSAASDYVTTSVGGLTARGWIGPYGVSGASTVAIQSVFDTADQFIEGLAPSVSDVYSDYADSEPSFQQLNAGPNFQSGGGVGEVYDTLDTEQALVQVKPINDFGTTARTQQSDLGTGPFFIGDGSTAGGGGGSNFNSGLN